MKRARQCIFPIVFLFCSYQLSAQKDSVQALFNPPKFNIHYSYLQWEFGYTGFVFSNQYLNGVSLDLFGMVFNDDVDVALGFEQAGGGTRVFHSGFIRTLPVQNYSQFYLKAEPMLFPDKIINISTPLKIGYSSLSYADTSTTNTGGYGRRGRNRSITFPSVEPGVFVYVNIFSKLNLGGGVSYRVALATSSAARPSDYDNFLFSVLLRLKLYTGSKRKTAAKTDEYYMPPSRFQ